MSNDENAVENSGKEYSSIFDQPEGADWFLAFLINFADQYDVEQSVTLNAGGALISGTIISGRTYFKEVGENLMRTGKVLGAEDHSLVETLAKTYANFSEVYPKPESPNLFEPKRQTAYIHLRNVNIIGPSSGSLPIKVPLWRGKLASVDGYSLGGLEVTKS